MPPSILHWRQYFTHLNLVLAPTLWPLRDCLSYKELPHQGRALSKYSFHSDPLPVTDQRVRSLAIQVQQEPVLKGHSSSRAPCKVSQSWFGDWVVPGFFPLPTPVFFPCHPQALTSRTLHKDRLHTSLHLWGCFSENPIYKNYQPILVNTYWAHASVNAHLYVFSSYPHNRPE